MAVRAVDAATGSEEVARESPRAQTRRPRRTLSVVFWYAVLISISVVTVLPFAWMLLTSLKGPEDAIFSVPPQFIPQHPTLDNYAKVLDTLPVAEEDSALSEANRRAGKLQRRRIRICEEVDGAWVVPPHSRSE